MRINAGYTSRDMHVLLSRARRCYAVLYIAKMITNIHFLDFLLLQLLVKISMEIHAIFKRDMYEYFIRGNDYLDFYRQITFLIFEMSNFRKT